MPRLIEGGAYSSKYGKQFLRTFYGYAVRSGFKYVFPGLSSFVFLFNLIVVKKLCPYSISSVCACAYTSRHLK